MALLYFSHTHLPVRPLKITKKFIKREREGYVVGERGGNTWWIRLWGDSTQRREDAKMQRSERREGKDMQ